MTIKQYFCVDESLNKQEDDLNAQQQSLHDCNISQKLCESLQINCIFRLSLGLSRQIMEFHEEHEAISTSIFFYFGRNMLKAK